MDTRHVAEKVETWAPRREIKLRKCSVGSPHMNPGFALPPLRIQFPTWEKSQMVREASQSIHKSVMLRCTLLANFRKHANLKMAVRCRFTHESDILRAKPYVIHILYTFDHPGLTALTPSKSYRVRWSQAIQHPSRALSTRV